MLKKNGVLMSLQGSRHHAPPRKSQKDYTVIEALCEVMLAAKKNITKSFIQCNIIERW